MFWYLFIFHRHLLKSLVIMSKVTCFIPRVQKETALTTTNAVRKQVETLKTNEGEWTRNADISTWNKFLVAGEACVAGEHLSTLGSQQRGL